MSDYETMNDFEINSAVAKFIYNDSEIVSKHEMMGANTPDGVQVIHETGFGGRHVDYCNVASDAWPIIVENRISIDACDKDYADPSYWSAFGDEGSIFNCPNYQDRNPLRAAMIVFLMVQEQSNDQG